MFFKVINKIKYKFLLSIIKPEIIGYKDSKGDVIEKTGSSNMSHISNKRNVVIGKNVFIGHFNYIDGYNKVVIGDGCQITNYVSIVTHSTHNTIRLYGYKGLTSNSEIGLLSKEVSIGEFSYVGAHSVIMPGSKIGKGCIISAFSFVNGSFPEYSILRGQPARIIGNTKDIDNTFLEEFPELKEFYYDTIKNH